MQFTITKLLLTMSKYALTGFIVQFLLFSLALAYEGNTQNKAHSVKEVELELEFNNASLQNIFSTIEEATEFDFIFYDKDIASKKAFSMNKQTIALSELLLELSKTYDFAFRQLNRNITVKKLSKKDKERLAVELAQDVTITGKVTDENGEGLPGASIVVKGSTQGTTSDMDGNFKLTVPDNATIVVSYVGYMNAEIAVDSRAVYDISMQPDAEQLEEIVVTALGVEKSVKSLGYSMTKLEGKEISKSSTVSPVLALKGKVAGVDIAPTEGGVFGGSRITIRGNSTLKENNQPIFVIDGIIMDNNISGGSEWGGDDWGNDLKNLNSDDFETVSVLKGAAATALYGARALNGAIVITTKKGSARKGIGVDVTQTFNTKHVYDGPDFQNVYGEGAPPGYDAGYDDIYNPAGGFKLDGNGDPFIEGTTGGWVPISYGPKMDGSRIKDWNGEWINYTPKPDNYKQVFERGFYSNTNVSFNGGSEKSTFIVSISNTSEKGTFPRNKFNRTSYFTKATHRLNDFISAQVGASYSISTAQNPPTNIMQNFITGAWPRNYDAEKWKKNYRAPHGGVPSATYNDANVAIPGHGTWFSIYENTNQSIEESLRLTGDVTFTVTDWFNVKLNGYVNNYYTKSENKQLGQGFANEGGYYSLGHTRKEQNDLQLWLNFNKELTSDISARLSIIGEKWQTKETFNTSNTDGGLVVPGQYTISNSRNRAATSAGIRGGKQLNSVYFFTDLEWRDQVFLQVTGRKDWSSTLTYSDGTGNNSYFYPSVSASWVFSQSFANLPSFMDFGKVRASWAHVGNDYSPYSINAGFKSQDVLQSLNGDLQKYTFNSSQVPNLNLRPEDKKSIEMGVDLRFFEGRLGFDFTYYVENTYNQILSIPVPSESGVGSQLINAGNIQNKGIELALNTTPVVVGDFRWDLDFNFTRNRNKIIELYDGVTEFNLHGSSGYGNTRVSTMAFVGDAYGVLISDSKPKIYQNESNPDDPKNGMPLLTWHASQRGGYMTRSQEREKVGDMNPDFLAGINTRFSYKNLYASVLFDIKIGGDISTYSGRYGTAYGLFESTLANRDLEHGGFTWTSWQGKTYNDGYIPNGVFAEGSIVEMTDGSGNTIQNDVSGMTYKEAFEQGLVDPTHGGWWHWKNNTWGGGVITDAVVQENSYVGIREVLVGYNFPSTITDKLKVNSLSVSLFGRDLGFLYKSLKDNLNPFSIRSNRAGSAHEWQQSPYVMTLGGTIKVGI